MASFRPLVETNTVSRYLIVAGAILALFQCSAAYAAWTCKPVWHFSGMGDKTYEGSGADEASAKDIARKACVVDNRDLELDDFCLPGPKASDWHCSGGQRQAVDAAPQNESR
jgi:hypothetical protein